MKQAKPNENDIDALWAVAYLIDSMHPQSFTGGAINVPEWMDPHPALADGRVVNAKDPESAEGMRLLVDVLQAIAKKGSILRCAGALDVLMNPRNMILDPKQQDLAYHPVIEKAIDEENARLAEEEATQRAIKAWREQRAAWKANLQQRADEGLPWCLILRYGLASDPLRKRSWARFTREKPKLPDAGTRHPQMPELVLASVELQHTEPRKPLPEAGPVHVQFEITDIES